LWDGVIWADGEGVAMTPYGYLKTADKGATWAAVQELATALQGVNASAVSNHIDAVAFFSKKQWLVASSNYSDDADLTNPKVQYTADGGSSFADVCSISTPSGIAVPGVRQLKLWWVRGSRLPKPAVLILHPFALYRWNYYAGSGSCGSIVQTLPYTTLDSTDIVYVEQNLAVGCNPSIVTRGCLLMSAVIGVGYATADTGGYFYGPASWITDHTLKIGYGCGDNAKHPINNSIVLPAAMQTMTGSDVWGNSDILFGNSDNVLAYSAAFYNALLVSSNGGANWTHVDLSPWSHQFIRHACKCNDGSVSDGGYGICCVIRCGR
jgi:hypothetical protein